MFVNVVLFYFSFIMSKEKNLVSLSISGTLKVF